MKYKVDFYEDAEPVFSYLYPSLEYAMLAIENWCSDYEAYCEHKCMIQFFIDKGATA